MGVDKRGLLIDGVPMLRRTAIAVAAAANEVLVACRPGDPPDPAILDGLDVALIHDRYPDAGPLAGVEAALTGARHGVVLVVAGDMPWLEPRVLCLLTGEALEHPESDVVALATTRGAEPLLAVYRRGPALEAARRLLGRGTLRMHALLEALPGREVPVARWRELDPDHHTARNVNAPSDLRAWCAPPGRD